MFLKTFSGMPRPLRGLATRQKSSPAGYLSHSLFITLLPDSIKFM